MPWLPGPPFQKPVSRNFFFLCAGREWLPASAAPPGIVFPALAQGGGADDAVAGVVQLRGANHSSPHIHDVHMELAMDPIRSFTSHLCDPGGGFSRAGGWAYLEPLDPPPGGGGSNGPNGPAKGQVGLTFSRGFNRF